MRVTLYRCQWTPVTHRCRQKHEAWPKRLALALRRVLAWPKLLSTGSTSSSCGEEGHLSIPAVTVVLPQGFPMPLGGVRPLRKAPQPPQQAMPGAKPRRSQSLRTTSLDPKEKGGLSWILGKWPFALWRETASAQPHLVPSVPCLLLLQAAQELHNLLGGFCFP